MTQLSTPVLPPPEAAGSGEPYHLYAEYATDIIARLTIGGQYLYISPSCRTHLGYEPAELIGRFIIEQIHPDDQEKLRQANDAFGQGVPELMTVLRRRRKDGSYCWLETIARLIPPREAGEAPEIITVSRNITERKLAEAALVHSELKYRILLDNIPQRVFYKDRYSVFLAVNPSYARDFRLTPDDFVGKTDYDFYPRELAEKYRADDQRIMMAGITEELDEQYMHEGLTKVVHMMKTPVRDETGQVDGILGIFWDITRRKQAEEALAMHEQQLRALLDNIPDPAWLKDPQGCYLAVNESLAQFFGHPRDELIGKSVAELMPRVADELAKGEDQLSPARSRSQVDQRLLGSDGNLHWFDTVESLILDAGGNATGVAGIARDVTQRRDIEEALRESEERYRSIIAAMIEGMVLYDHQEMIVAANSSAERILGIPAEEIKGRTLMDPRWRVIHADGTPFTREEHPTRVVLATGRAVTDVIMGLAKPDGTTCWLSVNAIPWRYAGESVSFGVLATFHDITAHQQAEETLKRYAADLERANEEVRQFAYIVSHDLRAPLINLKGFADELRTAVALVEAASASPGPISDEAYARVRIALEQDIPEALDYIDSSTSRMDHYINALLRLSRMGRQEMSFEPLDLSEIVNAAIHDMGHQIEARLTTVIVYPLPEIIGDRTSIEQIIGNLLNNAVLYLEPGRPGKIEIRTEQQKDVTIISVRDNGRGIAEEDLPKVFAPFRRAGKQDVKGEGMGMAYAQALAYRHGGHIRCESTLGIGTTFLVTLSNHPE